MRKKGLPVSGLLKLLESFYGRQEPSWPTDPYLFLVWWHCGYPASDTACAKGWQSLTREIGVEPEDLLKASPANLGRALRPGGMVPELRAMRLKEIAARVKDEYAGDSARPSSDRSRKCANYSRNFRISLIPAQIEFCSLEASRP